MENKIILTGFVMLIFVTSYMITDSTTYAAENLNPKLYYNEEYSFSIEYPNGWKVDDSGNFIDDGVPCFIKRF